MAYNAGKKSYAFYIGEKILSPEVWEKKNYYPNQIPRTSPQMSTPLLG